MSSIRFLSILGLLGLVATGCGLLGGGDSRPTVVITAPSDGAHAATGREIEVWSTATDDTGIVRIDLYVNNELIHTQTPPQEIPQRSYSVVQRWVPPAPGPVLIKVLAYDTRGQASTPAAVEIEAVGSALVTASPTPTPAATATALPSPTAASATPTPERTIAGSVTVSGLNVRTGPDTTFDVITTARSGENLEAFARNDAGDWVQVRLQDGREGWVAAVYAAWEDEIAALPIAQ